ncbi:hypothetical protein [Clostridium lacusfryxellense]|uniref:hypothetical protein n=1 Tax=Clostridium lacusfryxellense TaxID=205328 RepID=UPI001C0CA757|nr:hypothetical protein [Clostridium lacusfryxellense]MBU3112538.1 hypothetical protein [Clostridium lacusfryxellense]
MEDIKENKSIVKIINDDLRLEILESKYKNMLSDKDEYIAQQKQELKNVYCDLIALQKVNAKNIDELINIKIDNNKQMAQLEGRVYSF